MEDAVKALLIAAGVLIGLMIVSLGVVLFSSLSQYADDAQRNIEENALQKFNEQFTRYINCEDISDATPEFILTIQDVVTVANLAYENNKNYGLEAPEAYNYYVTVNINGVANNLEQNISTKTAELLKEKSEEKLYKCAYSNVEINSNTGRVCKVTFYEYDNPKN